MSGFPVIRNSWPRAGSWYLGFAFTRWTNSPTISRLPPTSSSRSIRPRPTQAQPRKPSRQGKTMNEVVSRENQFDESRLYESQSYDSEERAERTLLFILLVF